MLSYAKSKDYTEFEYYIDGGYSGKDLNRPAIQKLIEDCKNHKIDAVFVFKLDRISRSQRDTLYLIEEVFLLAPTKGNHMPYHIKNLNLVRQEIL